MNPAEAFIKILVVDDHDSLRRNMVALLADEEFMVGAVPSAEEALLLMEQQFFGVVIVDIRLPGMSGEELIEKAIVRWPKTHFIVHTGSVDYLLPASFRALGLTDDDVFFKPIADVNKFLDRIRELGTGDSHG
jgi:DNA-binding NtrC family response regulator